jgi:hypothetical protein
MSVAALSYLLVKVEIAIFLKAGINVCFKFFRSVMPLSDNK